MSAVLPRGFADPVHESQLLFRSIMAAFAHPASPRTFVTEITPPPPLTSELAAIALALADHETPILLDRKLAAAPEVAAFLRFHCGAPIVTDPRETVFALIADPTAFRDVEDFAIGTDAYPDRSTTLVFAVDHLLAGQGLRFRGPGILAESSLAIMPEPVGLHATIARNQALFPRGNDCIFAAPRALAALPRSLRINAEN